MECQFTGSGLERGNDTIDGYDGYAFPPYKLASQFLSGAGADCLSKPRSCGRFRTGKFCVFFWGGKVFASTVNGQEFLSQTK